MFTNIIMHLGRLDLGIEQDKLELIHFRRAQEGVWSVQELLGPNLKVKIGGSYVTIIPKATMRYLRFFMDLKLTFKEQDSMRCRASIVIGTQE